MTRILRSAVAAVLAATLPLGAGLAAANARPDHVTAGTSAALVAPLVVTVDAMSPVSATDGTMLTVEGTIRNTSAVDVDVDSLLLGTGTPPGGRSALLADFVATPGIERVLAACSTCLSPELAAGGSDRYTVSVRLPAGLDRGVVDVYPVIVRVVGSDAVTGGAGMDLGETGTFLPYVPADAVGSPVHVAWLVPLTSAPAQDAAGDISDPGFPATVDTGGKLASLLAAVSSPRASAPVTLAIDPSLLAAAARTSVPGWRRSTDAPGGDHPADAGSAAFLTNLAARTRGQGVVALPYADPDAVALTRAGLGLDLSSAAATGRSEIATDLPAAEILAGTAWLAGDAVDQPTLDTYAAAGVTTLVLPGGQLTPTPAAFPPTQTAATTLDTAGPSIRGLVTDPDVEALLAAAGSDQPTARMAAQQLLAILALIVGELPNDTATRDLVLALPRGVTPTAGWLADVLGDTGTVGWLHAETLGGLIGDPTGTRDPLAPYPASARAAEIPTADLVGSATSIATLRRGVADLASALPDTTLTQPLDLALQRAESFAWRTDPAGAAALRNGVAARTAGILAGVRVAAATTVTLASRRASVPVTVENSLTEPVRVSLSLTAQDRTKLQSSPVSVLVPAGRKVRVLLPASTQRAGTFRALLTLDTPSGRAITTVPITVHSRAYGAITLVITFGALAFLVLAIAVRTVRRVRHRPRGDGSGGGPATGGGPGPAPDRQRHDGVGTPA